MQMKRAVVTGPTGAIGTALVSELVACGVEVIAVCREGSPRQAAIPKHPLVKVVPCNVESLSSLKGRIDAPCDAFFHLAWSGVYGADRADLHRQSANIGYTLDAAELAHALGCQVFVGAGSQSEFGQVDGPLSPELPTRPENGYGAAKLSAGHLSRLRCAQLGLRHCWCRIVSVYGPDDGEYTMMMSSIRKALRGEHLPLTKGEQVWDFLYNADAARALRLVAEKGKDGAVYVLGSGQARPLRAYLTQMRDIVNLQATLGFGEVAYYPNQAMHLEADISALTRDVGFTPQTSFEQGIRQTADWARAYGGCRGATSPAGIQRSEEH